MTAGRARVYALLTLASGSFAVWGSLFPFTFRRVAPAAAMIRLIDPWQTPAASWSLTDLCSNLLLFIPIGLSLGRRVQFENSSSSLVPYVEPVIIPTFGDGDSDVGVALGLGADLRINRRFELRLGIGIGDIENFSVGFSFTR